MNSLEESGALQQISVGENLAYILSDDTTFSLTESKLSQNWESGDFVKCARLLYNGKTELYYLTRNFTPLSHMASALDAKNFLKIATTLMRIVVAVREKGSLSCQNIEIDPCHIFVDPSTYRCYLIYFPIDKRLTPDVYTFENALRSNILAILKTTPSLDSPDAKRFERDLLDSSLPLKMIYERWGSESKARRGEMKLVAENAAASFELQVTKDSFIIGRKKDAVDGVIPFDRYVGRVHCKIQRQGSNFAITDLASTNGTFVNRVRLRPNEPCPIKDGDLIQLAKTVFKVCVE